MYLFLLLIVSSISGMCVATAVSAISVIRGPRGTGAPKCKQKFVRMFEPMKKLSGTIHFFFPNKTKYFNKKKIDFKNWAKF